nr:PIN-like domain-containing protein [uncultured Macellibacteroides sp.]
MKFPQSKIDVKEYHEKIYELIKDDDCKLFIDTNIIALFYGIHDSARKEFFDWLKTLIQKNRVKVPVWVINEYTNRFIRNQLQDYLSPLKKVSTIKKDFVQVSAFLKMHIEDSNLPQNKYTSINEFKDDLKEIEEKIEKIAFTAKNKDERYKLKIHDEIEQVFANCILESDTDNILNTTNELGLIRYNHKLPPGFEDGKKDLNSHGDLVLWYEILNYCKSEGVKKAILITDDEKKDWVYAPNKLVVNEIEKSNNVKPLLKIADPRLIHEFKIATQSEDFYIISFEQLTQMLIDNISNSFTNLAGALQLVRNQAEDTYNELNGSVYDIECDISVISTIEETIDVTEETNGNHETVETETVDTLIQEVVEEDLPYHNYALADRDFPLIDNSYFSNVIEKLKSYNWYVQNPCIDSLSKYDSKTLTESKSNNDSIFVIGRNIYQSACGGSGSAIDFIENLHQKFTKYTDYFINHLYSGILYEIYFDSSNTFRGDKLKSYYINSVLNVIELERLHPSIEFIEKALKNYEADLLYLPYKNESVKLEIVFEDETIQGKDWLGDEVTYLKIKEIKGNGADLLTEGEDNVLNVYYPAMNIFGLVDLLCKTYGIPSKYFELEIKPDIDKNSKIVMGDKKLATTRGYKTLRE